MENRPELSERLSAKAFRSHYYLKEELVAFCKAAGLPAGGGKIELTERIARYLDTGTVLPARTTSRPAACAQVLTEDAVIEENFVCSERHRAFFRERLGASFSFNVPFQRWLKANAGKTYAEALEAYGRILADKKARALPIDRQFEYNAYIRAFFADNPGKTLQQAIRCWQYKKALAGTHAYEPADLQALDAE